jgi:hypothetical protein
MVSGKLLRAAVHNRFLLLSLVAVPLGLLLTWILVSRPAIPIHDTHDPQVLKVIAEIPPVDWRLREAVPMEYQKGQEMASSISVAYLAPRVTEPTVGGYGSLQRSILTEEHYGKRLRFTTWVKTEEIEGWARLFLQADGFDISYLLFDDVVEQALAESSDWRRYNLVMDVPPGSNTLMFGVQMGGGKGKIWIANARLEEVKAEVAVTPARDPRNLGFEEGFRGWTSTPGVQQYERGLDSANAHSGHRSAYLAGGGMHFGTFYQVASADPFRGKRLEMSAYVKAKNLQERAMLWMQVDVNDPKAGYRRVASDNMGDRPILRADDWVRHSIVLDVPAEATHISFGITLRGDGKVWLDDVTFEVVGSDVATTGVPILNKPHTAFDENLSGWRNTEGSYRSEALADPSGGVVAKLTGRVHGPSGIGRLAQTVNAEALRGRNVRYSAWVKTALESPQPSGFDWIGEPGSVAGLWVRVIGPNSSTLHEDLMEKNPIKEITSWTRYELAFTVPDDSEYISYGAYIYGPGAVYIKNVKFEEVR